MGRWSELIEMAFASLGRSFPEIVTFLLKLTIAEAVVIGIGVAGVCVLYVVTVGYLFRELEKNKALRRCILRALFSPCLPVIS
jgi:hypothetical protein